MNAQIENILGQQTTKTSKLERVCKVLEECHAKVNRSCGTHVHMDATGMDLNTWKNIYKNYARLEDVIDGFMPLSRRNNMYCRGFRDFTNFESSIDEAETLEDIARIFWDSRYYKR